MFYPPTLTQVHVAEHEQFPTSCPCTQGIIIFLAIFLFAYLCLFVLGCCEPILAWQRPPYHVLITGQVIILCNISYFSARGYTSKFTHIYLGESGYPKLTMGIFRHPFLQDQKQMMNCRSCLCLQGNLGNLSRQKTLHIFPLPQLPALSCVCHPSFPSSSPSSKPPNSSLKPWGGVGCLPSSPACKLSPVKVTEPASERGVIYTTTPKTFHHT